VSRRVLCSLRTTATTTAAAAVEFLGGPQESNNETQEDCDRDRLVPAAGLLGGRVVESGRATRRLSRLGTYYYYYHLRAL